MNICGKPAGWSRKLGQELPSLRAWLTQHLLPEAESHSWNSKSRAFPLP